MPLDDIPQLDNLDADLDDLGATPTSLEVLEAILPYDGDLQAAAIGSRALAGGGGSLSDAVIKAPDTDERNRIIPAADTIALQIDSDDVPTTGTFIKLVQADQSNVAIELFNNAYDDANPACEFYADDAGLVYFNTPEGIFVDHSIDVSGSVTAEGMSLTFPGQGAANVPRFGQLTSYVIIENGALPNTGAWVSGTAKQNPTTGGDWPRQVTIMVEVVTDGTANAATCAIAISPDNTTYTTIGTPGASAAVNTVGAVTQLIPVMLPQGWYIKLTLSHVTVAASVYY